MLRFRHQAKPSGFKVNLYVRPIELCVVHNLLFVVYNCRRLNKLAEEFYTYVSSLEVSQVLEVDVDCVDVVRSFWILKRQVIHSIHINIYYYS